MTRRFLIFLSALALVLTGCGKEPHPRGQVFNAVAESFGPDEDFVTKTALGEITGGYSVSWNSGDHICINGSEYRAASVSGGTASFVLEGSAAPSPTFKACYPYSMSSWSGGTMSIDLPGTQAEPASGLVSGFPMYAESRDNTLAFKNLCGLLKLDLKAASGSFTVSSIELKSNNLSLSGECAIVPDGSGAWQASPSTGPGTRAGVTYTCEREVSNASASSFLIFLPPGGYTGFDITINTDAGTVHKVSKNIITIQRSLVTTISFSALDPHYSGHDFVDLGLPSGNKWATMNVGASSVTDVGADFTWEAAQTVPWGGAWRVPAQSEIEELFKKTYWRWTDNYKSSNVAGFMIFKTEFDAGNMNDGMVFEDGEFHEVIGEYNEATDVHIFLPETSADYHQGVYWTSSEDAEDAQQAYRLHFSRSPLSFGYRDVNYGGKTLTLPVRPVCD